MEETDPRYSRRIRSRLSTENMLGSSTLQVSVILNYKSNYKLYNTSMYNPNKYRRVSKIKLFSKRPSGKKKERKTIKSQR